ncbi:unnamed protein product (macronuclear) [Paramecium tetraurelia]|uniref:EGF-like domain-containing protein n=1 Tax=Paramecium tetraurelia TaxID=5888 RepID=A0BTQ9_PARTE|nr:uncharacterized protein GSPATT00032158001 [Paramecium tetraurelia]CAK61926.1 unnamed protein product [Paramecium tetraurelia]|eukprot:XP_001429324.1 hypothetical protein (macronuclear) [Paramecium tetraurelia strain d4-2]
MTFQLIGAKLISAEDYNLINDNWCVLRGNKVTNNNYLGEGYLGGLNAFKQDTLLQNYYNLPPHSQVTIQIKAIFSCIQSFHAYLDDAIQTIDNSSFSTSQPSYLVVASYFHSSKSAFFSLNVTEDTRCPNNDIWWGVFAIEIQVQDCQENNDYCQPGSNILWKILNSNLNFKPMDWNYQGGPGSINSYTFTFSDFQIESLHYSNIKLQKYFQIPYPTKVKFKFKLLFYNIPSSIKIHINDLIVGPIIKCFQYNFGCNNGGSQMIYNLEIDIHQHKSDILSFVILLQENSGSNQVSIFDFVVYYQEQYIVQLPSLGCLNWIGSQCVSCEQDWQYDGLNQCSPICGNGIIQGYEECDDGNGTSNDSCYNCKFQCSLGCLKCKFGECLQWSDSYNLDQYNTISKIQDCSHAQGYYFDYLLNECLSICGDGIITLKEECDDGNTLLNDGCYNCQLICSDNCLDCQFGKCYQCNQGYKIKQFKCISDCGDQITNIDETCDDGNNIRFDGCHQCQSSCQLQCMDCQNFYCIKCLQGWNLINGKCEEQCGDGQVALMSNEQCDDPTNTKCIDCLFQQCQDNCLVCNQHQCVTCFFPYQLINGVCQPICGDSIVTIEFEQCDDGNDIPFDGCHQCQYSCQYGCQQCEQDNICTQCEQNLFYMDIQTGKCKEIVKLTDNEMFSLNETNNQTIQCNPNYLLIENTCVNQCGNGMLSSPYEECDDGNNYGGDGCSSLCNLENFFQCQNGENLLSICSFIQPPDFNLNSLSDKKNQIQIVEFTFTQQVKLNSPSNLEDIAILRITPQVQHDLSIIPKENLTTYLNNPAYQIIIQFYNSIENPKLEIEISKFVITNQFDLELLNFNKIINLGTPFVMSKSTKQQVTSVVKFNDAMIYSMVSIAGLAMVTGNVLMLLNLLELLQSLSYIRYMQYQFPPNLREFLETYTKVSMQPILDYFQVDKLIAQLNGGFLPYKRKDSSKQSSNFELNQIYIMNAKSCYFSLLASSITYVIYSILASEYVNVKLFKIYSKQMEKMNYLKYIKIFQSKIQQQCQKMKNNYFSQGIFQLYFTILHQLAFSAFLQFPDYTFETLFESLNSLNAMLGLLLIIFVSFKVLSITSSPIRNMSRWKYFYLGSRCQYWSLHYKSLQILKVKFYIFVIVICMNYPEIQSILLSMQSLCYLIYLFKFRPITSNFDLVKLMIRESFLMAIFCSFLLYSLDSTNDQQLLYGWMHIILFSIILSTSLVADMIEYCYKLYQKYLKKKMKELEKENNKYYDNPLQRFILIEQQNIVI